jgi:hypothetical protein
MLLKIILIAGRHVNETGSSWSGPVLLGGLKIQPLQQFFQSSPEKPQLIMEAI